MKNISRYARLLALISVALLSAAACVPITAPAPVPDMSSNTITDIVWQWTSVANRTTSETAEIPDAQNYTLMLWEDGTLSGQADCNQFTGSYSQEGGFFITLGATTMATCGDASLDQQYLQLLTSIAAGGPDGAGGLALETAGGEQRMEFMNGGTAVK